MKRDDWYQTDGDDEYRYKDEQPNNGRRRKRKIGRLIFWIVFFEIVALIGGLLYILLPKEDPQVEELLAECGLTLLFVEHDRAFCDRVATRVVEL